MRRWIRIALYASLSVSLANTATALISVGAFEAIDNAADVAIVDELAYVSDSGFGLRIIDISDTENPEEIGNYPTYGNSYEISRDLQVSDGFAYVYLWDEGIQIIDVMNPSAPIEVNVMEFDHDYVEFDVVDGLAYVVTESRTGASDLLIIDVSDPLAPVQIGTLDLVGVPASLTVEGDLVYVGIGDRFGNDEPTLLRVIDVSDPTAPVEVGSTSTRGVPGDIEVVDDLAYITTNPPGFISGEGPSALQIFDVSDPSVPAEKGALQFGDGVGDVEVVEGLAYLTRSTGIQAVDISDPSAPGLLGILAGRGFARDIEGSAGLA
jgi:hypothetical protein